MELLKDLQANIEKTDEFRQRNSEVALKNPLSLVADGVGSLGWVGIAAGGSTKSYEYIKELFGGAQMYGNNVLKEYKDKYAPCPSFHLPDALTQTGQENKVFVQWVQAYYKLFLALAEYAKKHHPNGVVWNSSGIDAKGSREASQLEVFQCSRAFCSSRRSTAPWPSTTARASSTTRSCPRN